MMRTLSTPHMEWPAASLKRRVLVLTPLELLLRFVSGWPGHPTR